MVYNYFPHFRPTQFKSYNRNKTQLSQMVTMPINQPTVTHTITPNAHNL